MVQTHNFIGLPLLDYFQNAKRHLMTLHNKRDTDCLRISQFVDKVPAPQRALFSRSVSGIKKASFARFFDTTDSIGSVVPIERLSKTMFFDSPRDTDCLRISFGRLYLIFFSF